MTPLTSADGCLAPEVLSLSLPPPLLAFPPLYPRRPGEGGPPARLLLSLPLKDFDREGNLTLCRGWWRWRRGAVEVVVLLHFTLQIGCATCFVSDKLAVCCWQRSL